MMRPQPHIRTFREHYDKPRYPDVPNTTIKLLLFPFSLDGVAKTWLDKEPPNSILTWDDLVSKFINFFFPPSKTTNLRNEITNFRQIAQESFSEAWERFKELLRKCPHHGFSLMHQLDTFYNSLSYNDQDSLNSAAGGNFLYKSPNEGLQIIENKAKVRSSRNAVMRVSTNAPPPSNSSSSFEFQQMAAALEDKMTLTFRNELNEMKNMMKALVPTPVPIKAVEERNECKGITTRSGVVLDGPLPPMPPPFVNPDNEVAKETEVTKDQVQLNSSQSTARVQPPVVQIREKVQNKGKEPLLRLELIMNFQRPKQILPYLQGEKDKNRERDDILASKFIEIFRDLHFELSFADALVHMPKFALMIKKLLSNKDKLIEITKTPMNANLTEFDNHLALADLGASINLMPLSIWKKLGLPDLTNPRVPLILGRPFLSTAHALIDVYAGEIILRHDDQSLVLKCGDTPTISYDNFESVKRIDLIDATCAEYAPKVLDFTESGDSTSIILDPPPFTPFEGSEMIIEEEIEEFLKHDESLNMDLNDDFNDEEGDVTYLENLLEDLNDDPFSSFIPCKFKKQIKNVESVKTSIEEPPDLELKDLPSHLEYAFLENKVINMPVIIS
ncbi:reverse transcriptase domain-containing protein [Tanacetum coccineum]|uniref:Reverse transcriptase domain-containing protein n=1 Tax=Tanacetum coccineum TaxID=301880 RepID=A0ABQ4YU76_9ASTR